MIQKVKDKSWTDESGAAVPVEYVTAGNRLKERSAAQLVKGAKAVNKSLQEFKDLMERLCGEVYKKAMEEYKAKTDGRATSPGSTSTGRLKSRSASPKGLTSMTWPSRQQKKNSMHF